MRRSNILIILFLSIVAALLLFVIYKINQTNSKVTISYTDATNALPVGHISESENSFRVIGFVSNPQEEDNQLLVTVSTDRVDQQALVYIPKIPFTIQLQDTTDIFPPNKNFVIKDITDINRIKDQLIDMKGQPVILSFPKNVKIYSSYLNPSVLKCNEKYISAIESHTIQRLDCLPYVNQITAYVKKL